MDRSRAIKDLFFPFGEVIAENLADELEKRGGLLQPRETYVRNHAREIVSAIDKGLKKKEQYLKRASEILQEHLFLLSGEEREKKEDEISGASKKVISLLTKTEEASLQESNSLQSFLGLSQERDCKLNCVIDL